MVESDTKKEITKPVKPKIISCLLENELTNTAAIAKYCGYGGKKNPYRYVDRQLDELVKNKFITEVEKYRPEESRWRSGTGYRLTRDLGLIWMLYLDKKYADIRHKFRESKWLRELIIESRILSRKEKNKKLLHLMLQTSPSFFKMCFVKFWLTPLTIDTLRSWETPVGNIDWFYHSEISKNMPRETLNKDIQFLELYRFCLFQDWVESYPDEKIPDDLIKLLTGVRLTEERECKRVLDTVLEYCAAESIRDFKAIYESDDRDRIKNLNALNANFDTLRYKLATTEVEKQPTMKTQLKATTHEISATLGWNVEKSQKEPLDLSQILEKYLEKMKSIPGLR